MVGRSTQVQTHTLLSRHFLTEVGGDGRYLRQECTAAPESRHDVGIAIGGVIENEQRILGLRVPFDKKPRQRNIRVEEEAQ